MANILANPIKDKAHLKVFDDMAAERFANIDLSALLPCMIDTVPVEMLPYLAKQRSVLGYKGWRFITTEAEKRALIKNAIEVNKYRGSEWSILEGLKLIGMDPVTIKKGGYELYCDGDKFPNGTCACGGVNPFTMQVEVDAGIHTDLGEQVYNDMLGLIMENKAGRTLLTSIDVANVGFTEDQASTDALNIDLTISGVTTNHVL